jgi:predicted alpha/beta-hydrolase family hydrolase
MSDPLVTEYEWQGPKRGADRAVLLAHGAGSDMHGTALVRVADALAAAKIPSLRFNFPYRTAGRNAPDRPKVLDASVREAAVELARRAKLPPERLVLGGRSMGGRYCSMVVGDADDPLPALGLVMLSYPLHAAGKPDRPRAEHFPGIRVPILFVSGTRDSMAGRADLTKAARKVKGPVSFHWIDTADHSYRPLKASGRTAAEVLDEVAATTVAWVAALGS